MLKPIKNSEMQLADVVRLQSDVEVAWADNVVVQIKDGAVTLWRPYMTTSDFSYTGGVIPYIGMSIYNISVDDTREMFMLVERRSSPLK